MLRAAGVFGAPPRKDGVSVFADSLRTLYLLPHKSRHCVIGNQGDATNFPALTDAHELPVSTDLALIIKAPAESEVRIDPAFRQTKKFGTLRRTRRRLAWRNSYCRLFAGVNYRHMWQSCHTRYCRILTQTVFWFRVNLSPTQFDGFSPVPRLRKKRRASSRARLISTFAALLVPVSSRRNTFTQLL